MYLIGKITTTHGIRGEVKILNLSDYPRFNVGDKVYINDTPYEIESSRPHKGQLIIKLSHVNTMNDGLLLKDQDVYAKERIEDDDYHYEDIIGCEVKTLEGVLVGVVKSIREVPQGSILEVQTDKKIVLIPFVDAFVKEIYDDYILIDPIEGLL
jgi:16S rRNA processing protein RimM